MVNKLEWLRKQIDDVQQLADEVEHPLSANLDAYDSTIVNVEKRLFQLTLTGTFADDLRGPTMLYSKLMNLAYQVQEGDFRPTDQQKEVFELHKQELATIKQAYEGIKPSLVELNRSLSEGNLPTIVIPDLKEN